MKNYGISLLFLLFAVSVFANTKKFNLEDRIPVDSTIRIGKLENGLTYYIKYNKQPEKRVEMRLAVNAGSLQETDNQKGLAHFVEHMCFNGTKNFEKNELVSFLEKMGIKFGAELNAYTSFEETVYMLTIPTDKAGLVDTGLMVLQEWAQNVTFDEKEIDKERGVITEEWRLGLGADDRMLKQYLPVALKGSLYTERLPIGDIHIIENCPYDTLRQFYKDWYRPDLMAIVIVGDINVDEMEKKIRNTFSELTNPPVAKQKPPVSVPDNKEPLISIVTDKENPYSVIQFFIKHDKTEEKTVYDYRMFILQRLYNGMINARFAELMQKPVSPFLYATSGYGNFIGRAKDAYYLYAVAKENEILNSLSVLIEENEKVKKFGFTSSELERQKKEILTMYEKAVKEKDKTESEDYAAEFIRNFLENEPIPGISYEYEIAKQFLPEISLDEINALAAKWIIDTNWVIVVTAPENNTIKVPSQEELLATINLTQTKEISAYLDNQTEGALIPENLKDTKIKSKKTNKKYGFTEVLLANGVKVILKPNNYKNDEILFQAFSPGGHSVYPDSLIFSAKYTPDVINSSGLGAFDEISLQKKLAGNTASAGCYLSAIKEGLKGSSSPSDLETLMQLIYLYFQSPRKDTSAFETFLSKLSNQVKFIKVDPNFIFYDTLVKTVNTNHPRYFVLPSDDQLDKIRLDDIYSIYRDRFADASDFTFIFVGNFETDAILPYIKKYLGNLPNIKRKETWKNVNADFPKGITKVVVHKGIEPQSRVSVMMKGTWVPDINNLITFNLLTDILAIKLRESMREDQGGVYGVRVSKDVSKYPVSEYSISISFGCSPNNVDSLVNTIFTEMKKLQSEGPNAVDLEKVIETAIRQHEINEKTNSYWVSQIESLLFNGFPILSLTEFKNAVKEVTSESIKTAAKSFFRTENYVEVVLMPETKE